MCCCFDEKAGRKEVLTAFVRASCHVIARAAATYWASATVSFQNLAVRLSFSFGPLGERVALFATISSLESGRKAIIERTQCTKEEPPLLLLGMEDGAHLSLLSFCGDEDYCSRRSLGPLSLLSLLPIL